MIEVKEVSYFELLYSRTGPVRVPTFLTATSIRRPVIKVVPIRAFLLFSRLLSGQPPLSGHYPFPRGWPFIREIHADVIVYIFGPFAYGYP